MASRDYYELLGVPRGCWDDVLLRQAYRKQCIKHHPDKNRGDAEAAELLFKEIHEAYEVLSDPEKHATYDVWGEEGLRRARSCCKGGFSAPSEVFAELFRAMADGAGPPGWCGPVPCGTSRFGASGFGAGFGACGPFGGRGPGAGGPMAAGHPWADPRAYPGGRGRGEGPGRGRGHFGHGGRGPHHGYGRPPHVPQDSPLHPPHPPHPPHAPHGPHPPPHPPHPPHAPHPPHPPPHPHHPHHSPHGGPAGAAPPGPEADAHPGSADGPEPDGVGPPPAKRCVFGGLGFPFVRGFCSAQAPIPTPQPMPAAADGSSSDDSTPGSETPKGGDAPAPGAFQPGTFHFGSFPFPPPHPGTGPFAPASPASPTPAGPAPAGAAGGATSPAPTTKKDRPIEIPLTCRLEELFTGSVRRMRITRRKVAFDGSQLGQTSEILTINVAPGWRPGTRVAFQEKGDEHWGRRPADVVFVVSEKPHPRFARVGNDLVHAVKVSLVRALCGTTVQVETLDGRHLDVCVPGVIRPGLAHVVEGEGMPLARDPKTRGNLIVKFDVVFPSALDGAAFSALRAALPDAELEAGAPDEGVRGTGTQAGLPGRGPGTSPGGEGLKRPASVLDRPEGCGPAAGGETASQTGGSHPPSSAGGPPGAEFATAGDAAPCPPRPAAATAAAASDATWTDAMLDNVAAPSA